MRVSFFNKRLIHGANGEGGREAEHPLRRRIAVLTLSNISLQVLGFLYRMMLARLAGSEALGLQSLVMQVYAIMVSVCISGMNVAVITSVSGLPPREREAGVRRIARGAFLLFLLLFLAMALPLFVLRGSITRRLIGDPAAGVSIVLVLGCILLTGAENILKSIHIASGRIPRTAISELLEQSVRFLLVFLLLKSSRSAEDHTSVALITAGMLGSEFVSVSFLSVSYKKLFTGGSVPKPRRKDVSAGVSALVRVLVPAALTSISGTVFASASALLLPGRLALSGYTRQQALAAIGALNAVAMPLVMLPMTFVGAVSVAIMPEITGADSKGDFSRTALLVKRSIVSAAAAVLFINLPALPFLGRAAGALFGLVPTRESFRLLTLFAGIIYLQIVTTSILNGLMKQRTVLGLAIFGESLQLVLILLLAARPGLHIYGYLIAKCIGEGLRLLIASVYLRRLLKSGFRFKPKVN